MPRARPPRRRRPPTSRGRAAPPRHSLPAVRRPRRAVASCRALRPIWDVLPRAAGEERPIEAELTDGELLPDNRAHFRYAGSLTTPPCTEGVRWHVLEQPIEMSNAQVNKFIRALNRSCCLENARPTQPLNGRQVTKDRE